MANQDRDYVVQFFEDATAQRMVADTNYCIRAGDDTTIGEILDNEIRQNPALGHLHIVITPS